MKDADIQMVGPVQWLSADIHRHRTPSPKHFELNARDWSKSAVLPELLRSDVKVVVGVDLEKHRTPAQL